MISAGLQVFQAPAHAATAHDRPSLAVSDRRELLQKGSEGEWAEELVGGASGHGDLALACLSSGLPYDDDRAPHTLLLLLLLLRSQKYTCRLAGEVNFPTPRTAVRMV